jgi:acetoacetyl-CoA synthetase
MSGLDNQPLWIPSSEAARASQMAQFFAKASAQVPGAPRADAPYAEWHAWSVREPVAFWRAMASFAGVTGDLGREILRDGEVMRPPHSESGPHWFPDSTLNFAEHLLRRRDSAPAIIARDERGRRRELSWAQLQDEVQRVASWLTSVGVVPGDRVVGFLPNIPEAVIAALAASWIGAVWSSCSPDFGAQGVLDRFGQIAPKVMFCADGYTYAGKRIDCLERVAAIVESLAVTAGPQGNAAGARGNAGGLAHVVVVPFLDSAPDLSTVRGVKDRLRSMTLWSEIALESPASSASTPRSPAVKQLPLPSPLPLQLPFNHPLYVMYSSGTTGLPKCMVHGAGGTLLQHLKEHRLHCDLRPGDRMFYFTTCGWMMWNWLVSALASEVTIVLYDGAPMPPGNDDACWDLVAEERVTHFGTSAKFLALSQKAGHAPVRSHDLSALRAILSTGSPLAEHSYDFVYRDVKRDVHLASISGGTDIISCFALGNPMLPVWRGELQCFGLGMAVDVWDEHGKPVRGEPGELVCTKPFPSMPVGFWNDADGKKYRAAYFEHFPNTWRHGDWAAITAHDGLVIHGRSDATLNPGGVRIGTAEIYREVEQLDEVVESIVVGQDVVDGAEKDVRIVLFVRLRDGLSLDDALRDRIKKAIRARTSPHHVPKVIVQVADIPRTISNKISEIAVRDVIHGRPVKNTEALANPKALELYRDLPELRLLY